MADKPGGFAWEVIGGELEKRLRSWGRGGVQGKISKGRLWLNIFSEHLVDRF